MDNGTVDLDFGDTDGSTRVLELHDADASEILDIPAEYADPDTPAAATTLTTAPAAPALPVPSMPILTLPVPVPAQPLLIFELVNPPSVDGEIDAGHVRINGIDHHVTLIPVEDIGSRQQADIEYSSQYDALC